MAERKREFTREHLRVVREVVNRVDISDEKKVAMIKILVGTFLGQSAEDVLREDPRRLLDQLLIDLKLK